MARDAKLPPGVFVEWTGQFEHAIHARQTLTVVVPIVVALIFLILYLTYHDLADAALMMLAVPGAIAGGLFFQWFLALKLSVTVWIGYIACFGMATSTGIIMLVYLREAVAKAGGLERIDLSELRLAVLNGAVHRLRPKLLTEGTVVLGLAPMLWASGVASEIIRPMAAPGPGRDPGGGRGDRPVSARAVFLGAPPALGTAASARRCKTPGSFAPIPDRSHCDDGPDDARQIRGAVGMRPFSSRIAVSSRPSGSSLKGSSGTSAKSETTCGPERHYTRIEMVWFDPWVPDLEPSEPATSEGGLRCVTSHSAWEDGVGPWSWLWRSCWSRRTRPMRNSRHTVVVG